MFSPGSLTLLRSISVLSSVTLGLRGSAPSRSRSLRGSSGFGLSSSSLELPPLMNGPGRADGAAEISGLSLRSLPVLERLFVKGGGKKIKSNRMLLNKRIFEKSADNQEEQIRAGVVLYPPRVLLESYSGFWGGVVEG